MRTETGKKMEIEYPEIEGCQYITQQDEVATVQDEAGKPEDQYITRTLYLRLDDSVFFIKTRRWLPWWGTEPTDMGDETLPDAQAALKWATDVAGMNANVAARLIIGADE